MIATPALAWTLTAWFGVLGMVSVLGLASSVGWTDRVSYAAHVVMCGAMSTMPWSWAMSVPAIVWIVVFTGAGLWYVWLALFRPRAAAGPGGGHHAGGLLLGYHAVMMTSMAWMSVVMTAMMSTMGLATGSGGMGMDDMAGLAATPTTAAPALWSPHTWIVVVTLAFVAVFAAAAIWFFSRLLVEPAGPAPGRGLPALAQTGLSLAMALGMGVSFLVMS